MHVFCIAESFDWEGMEILTANDFSDFKQI